MLNIDFGVCIIFNKFFSLLKFYGVLRRLVILSRKPIVFFLVKSFFVTRRKYGLFL